MAWVRLDDQFPDHPKLAALAPVWRLFAQHLYINALCWANRHMTDGVVPSGVVNRLAADCMDLDIPHMPLVTPTKIADELVSVGLWEVTEAGDYLIHDYLDYQPSREQIFADKAHKRELGRKGGLARGLARGLAPRLADGLAETQAEAQAKSKPNPNPGVSLKEQETHTPTPSRARANGHGDGSWDSDALWALWCQHAATHHAKQPLIASPGNFEHLRVLLESYSADELTRAVEAWWASPHTGGRNLGLFRSQVGEVLEHLANGRGEVFRAPRPKVVTPEFDPEKWAANMAAKRGMA